MKWGFLLLGIIILAACEPTETTKNTTVISTSIHEVDSWETDNPIVEKYIEHIKQAEKRTGSISCYEQVEVEKIEFEHLKTKKDVYILYSTCNIQGCPHPACTVSNWLYYDDVIFEEFNTFEEISYKESQSLEQHFTTIFENIENEEQLMEYLDLANIATLNLYEKSLEHWEIDENDCEFLEPKPDVSKLISKNQDYTYEGFVVDPEHTYTIHYAKYSITEEGNILTIESEVIAECGEGILF